METLLRAMGEMVQIANSADVRKMNGRTTRTHIDLFSGIGGFALACRWAGIETIAFCEIEKYAQRVLRKNFPGIRIFEDVRQFPATEFREPFLLTGGYPCQPFSQAGKRRGAEDDRHLWPSMFGIIRTSRPTWILAENVAGHVTLGLDEVLADLESEGYAVQPIIVPACSVDAPHRRDRVWVLANAKSNAITRARTKSKDCEKYTKQDGTTDKPTGASSGDSSWILGNDSSKLGDECGEYRETSRRRKFPNLETQVARSLLPTPCSRDFKDPGNLKNLANHAKQESLMSRVAKLEISQETKTTGALNPTFVEWLMGYPESGGPTARTRKRNRSASRLRNHQSNDRSR